MSFWRSTDSSWRLAHLQGVMAPVEPSSLRSDLEEPTKDDPEMQRDTNNFNISINAGICPRKCAINVWHHHILAKTILWQNDILAKWYCGKTILWQNDMLAKSYFGKMILCKKIFWQHHILGYTLAAFQTNTLFKANDFANWLTKEPQFEWQKNHFWSSLEKNAARTPWSKRTPQEPESCATKSDFDLLIRLRRTVRYAKGGARLGCVLSSRVPGRRDAAVHEHALKSGAAHTGFPCKDRSAKLEFEMFWSWNHVSWSFYRFMLCDKRHCLQVLWFEAGSTHCKQANAIQVFES